MTENSDVVQRRLFLTGFLVLSLLIKILMVVFSQEVNPDAVRYINAARLFSQAKFEAGTAAGGDTFLLPWLIYLLHRIIPNWVLAAQLISAVAIGFSVVPYFFITRKLFGAFAAVWVGLALVLSPILNEYSIEVIRDPLFLLFFGWAIWSILHVLDGSRPVFVVLSFVFSLIAFLFRVEAIVIIVFFAIALLFYSFRDSSSRCTHLKYLTLYFSPLLILYLVFMSMEDIKIISAIRLDDVSSYFLETLRFDIFETYKDIYVKLKVFGSSLPNAKWNHSFGETALHFMPLVYLIGLVHALISACYPPFFVLIFIGLLRSKVADRSHAFCLSLALVYLVAAYFFLLKNNFISDRYLLAPAMLLLPWLGSGMEKLFEMTRWRFLLPILVVFFFGIPVADTAKTFFRQESTMAQAGAWLKETIVGRGERLLFNDDRSALYAGLWYGEYGIFIDQELQDVEQLLQNRDFELLVYQTSPKKRMILSGTDKLRLIKEFAGNKQLVLIYRRV